MTATDEACLALLRAYKEGQGLIMSEYGLQVQKDSPDAEDVHGMWFKGTQEAFLVRDASSARRFTKQAAQDLLDEMPSFADLFTLVPLD